MLVEVEDEGEGFDPKRVPDPTAPENLGRPGGRGLLLVRSYMSWVRFHGWGNRVSLCKYRSAKTAAGMAPKDARRAVQCVGPG